MEDLGGYGITAQSFEFLCTLNTLDDAGRTSPRASPSVDPQRRQHGLDLQAPRRASSGTTARLHVGRRRRHDGAPRRGRQLRPQGRPRPGLRRRDRSEHRDIHPGRRQRQLPVPRLGLQRADADHAGRLRRRARRSTSGPTGTGAWKLVDSYDTRPARSSSATTTGGAARRRSTAPSGSFFDETGPMITAYQGGQVDAIVQFDVLTGGVAVRRPELHASSPRRRPIHRQIWMRCDTGQFAEKEVRQALACRSIRPALIQQLFKGRAKLGNDHVIWQGYPYFERRRPAARPRTSRRRSSSCRTPGSPT